MSTDARQTDPTLCHYPDLATGDRFEFVNGLGTLKGPCLRLTSGFVSASSTWHEDPDCPSVPVRRLPKVAEARTVSTGASPAEATTTQQAESDEHSAEIHRLRDLVKVMGEIIGGRVWRTQASTEGGVLRVYTVCSGDDWGVEAHARDVSRILCGVLGRDPDSVYVTSGPTPREPTPEEKRLRRLVVALYHDAWSSQPQGNTTAPGGLLQCPRCGAPDIDFDGFGVLACPRDPKGCYCSHPGSTDGICDICGGPDTPDTEEGS